MKFIVKHDTYRQNRLFHHGEEFVCNAEENEKLKHAGSSALVPADKEAEAAVAKIKAQQAADAKQGAPVSASDVEKLVADAVAKAIASLVAKK